MAQEFGDHPEAALDRMRWVRQLVGEVSASPAAPRPRGAPQAAADAVIGSRPCGRPRILGRRSA